MTDTSGAAFPGPSFTRAGHPNGHSMGMTLRDWFAGQALAWAGHDNWTSSDPSALAARAYRMADAMIAAREKRND